MMKTKLMGLDNNDLPFELEPSNESVAKQRESTFNIMVQKQESKPVNRGESIPKISNDSDMVLPHIISKGGLFQPSTYSKKRKTKSKLIKQGPLGLVSQSLLEPTGPTILINNVDSTKDLKRPVVGAIIQRKKHKLP